MSRAPAHVCSLGRCFAVRVALLRLEAAIGEEPARAVYEAALLELQAVSGVDHELVVSRLLAALETSVPSTRPGSAPVSRGLVL